MAQIRELKKRMTAVRTIQRITKTMQMIATARFTAALQRAKATQPYTVRIRQLVAEVSAAAGDVEHPLLGKDRTPVGRELLLVISSDRGMCGAYNGNVLRTSIGHLREKGDGRVIVDTSGRKAGAFFKFQKVEVRERWSVGDKPQYDDIEQIATRYIREYSDGEYDAIRVAYMRFISNSQQRPEIMQLMPISPESVKGVEATAGSAQYEFSPSSAGLLSDLLPLAIKTALFQAFIDAGVSEQIMRMIAMKAATENATELSRLLRRKFNRARQTKITTELMEVISGAAALE